jgi:hypothetical protein
MKEKNHILWQRGLRLTRWETIDFRGFHAHEENTIVAAIPAFHGFEHEISAEFHRVPALQHSSGAG